MFQGPQKRGVTIREGAIIRGNAVNGLFITLQWPNFSLNKSTFELLEADWTT